MQVNEKEEKGFTLQKRRCLIVWVYSLKQLKLLRRFGYVQYVSRRMKYVVLYMNEENIEKNLEKIHALHFVRKVEKSYRPDVEMNFAEKIGTKAAYQPQEEFVAEALTTEIRLAENV